MYIPNKIVCIEYLQIPSAKMLEENQQNIDCIEYEKKEPFWEYYEKYSPERLLFQFKDRQTNVKTWEVIPSIQYCNLLKRYMNDPIGSRIPDNIVTNWIMIICKNLAQVISIEKLFARCSKFPYETVEKYYNIKANNDQNLRLIDCMNNLSFSRFYFWAKSPQGNPAWNDWGFMKVYNILKEYREDMNPGDKLILIDRCLNVIHGRGPMAEYFIEGGKETLDKIFMQQL